MFLLFIQISWNNWKEMTWATVHVDNDLDLSLPLKCNRITLDLDFDKSCWIRKKLCNK